MTATPSDIIRHKPCRQCLVKPFRDMHGSGLCPPCYWAGPIRAVPV